MCTPGDQSNVEARRFSCWLRARLVATLPPAAENYIVFLFSSSPCSPTGICLHRSLRVRPTTRLEGGGGGFSAVRSGSLDVMTTVAGCGSTAHRIQSREQTMVYAEPRVGCIACSTHRCLKVVSVATAPNVAEPAQRTTELAPAPRPDRPSAERLLRHARTIEADLGAIRISPGPGRRLAAATAGLRKASELFKHSCPIYSHNEPI